MTVADLIKALQQLPFHDGPVGIYDMQGNIKNVELQFSGSGVLILCPLPGNFVPRKVAL